ncbi:hypothetical protein HID58_014607 [Brassica napus]|uniref:Uncharacterized protein n=1 Tax=Brassica napus TaxID=3708 RepID=A0ABQ8DHL5_BRANA|nr:hypothetical protein HID58_014607 [Brassica napus]
MTRPNCLDELMQFSTQESDIAAAANEALKRFKDESRKHYLTFELFRKLHLETKKEKPNPRNAPSQNADIYSNNHFRSYDIPQLLYAHVDRKEVQKEKPGTMLEEDTQLMEQRGT